MELPAGTDSVKYREEEQQHKAIVLLRTAERLAQRTVLFALLWWLLAEGDASSWGVGMPVVLLCVLLSHILAPPSPRSPLGLLQFIPFFALRSFKGAIDVAWRALHPAMPIAPLLVEYRLRLSDGKARVFMTNCISLLPGTLSAMLEGERLQVHVLDGRRNFRKELEALELRVAALFLERLEAEDDNG
jgi:multicomponent Na+:H+ antiporter subunit E